MIRCVDFFSGIGGFRVGLEAAGGFRFVAHSEIDPYACAVYNRHWPGSLNLGDLRYLRPEHIPEADLWCGGFPCQPFSVAGKRAGVEDERHLWPAWYGLIRVVRPRYLLLENVPGLLADGAILEVLGSLAATGYDAEWTVIGAHQVGAPHRRDRLWIWAELADTMLCHTGRNPRGVGRKEPETRRVASEPIGRSEATSRPILANASDAEHKVAASDGAVDEQWAKERRGTIEPTGLRTTSAVRCPAGKSRVPPRPEHRAAVADADTRRQQVERGSGLQHGERAAQRDDVDRCDGAVAYTSEPRSQGRRGLEQPTEGREAASAVGHDACGQGRVLAWPPGWSIDPADVADTQERTERPGLREDESTGERGRRHGNGSCPCCGADQGPVESDVGLLADELPAGLDMAALASLAPRVATGIPCRVQQLRCLGNSVVPAVVAWIGRRIREGVR